MLPLVEKQFNVKLTKDPDGRATMGCSSGGSAALAMAWYHTDLYHRVLTYSGTYVNQQWPCNPETPGGAWEFHETLIPKSPKKPLRIWLQVGDRDNFNDARRHARLGAGQPADGQVLADKGYHYQFLFTRDAGHCDRGVRLQTLPQALGVAVEGLPRRAGEVAARAAAGAGDPHG